MNKPESFFLYDVPTHSDIKDKLLLYFEDLTDKYHLYDNPSGGTSSTDYFKTKEEGWVTPYRFILDEHIYPIVMKNLFSYTGNSGIKLQGAWFQQYEHDSWFSYHTHPNSNFAGIYYVELPDGSATEFLNFQSPEVKEGQLLIFPSFLAHRSNPNPSRDRKTVVSFNFDLNYLA